MSDWIREPFQGALASATLAINERGAELTREGREIYRLGLGQSPFPVPDEVVEALRLHAPEKDYLPVQGLGELRQAVAEHHASVDGVHAAADQVVIGPGSKELLFLLQLVLDVDLVVPTPCWVSYPPQSRMVGRSARLIETRFEDDWRLDPADLAAAAREASGRILLVLNYPNNPTGLDLPVDYLEAIAAVVREHQVLVFSDEIYGRLNYSGAHQSLARFYPEGTIVGSGLSKWCGAGGWRLGTLLFPAELDSLRQAVVAAGSETFTSVSAPIQHAAISAFVGSPAIDDYLIQSRRVLAALAEALVTELSAAGLALKPPDGAFYAFVGFGEYADRLADRGIETSAQLAEAVLEETGVAMLPGEPFGREGSEFWVRIAVVDFDGSEALLASREVAGDGPLPASFVGRYCTRTLDALRRVSTWICSV